ncbi:MAG: phosphoethanolamine--lipid A transferase [Gammaproteobacteria bacterium]|nr:phosphoethanolamine--lipid A transferase [Gammaproteobacteria bacterium]
MTIRPSSQQLVFVTGLFIVATGNLAFFRNVLDAFTGQPYVWLHVVSLGALQLALFVTVVSPFAVGRATRPVLALLLLLGSAMAYFMDTYNVIIDSDMVGNAMTTDSAESTDLLTLRLALYVMLLGVLPAALVATVPLARQTPARAIRQRAFWIGGALLAAASIILLSSSFYASFFREHKPLRYYTNPLGPIYGAIRYATKHVSDAPATLKPVGTDANIADSDIDRELVVMVVGETARADHFSLNGYSRETNPRLADEAVVSFSRMSSCGTSTAVSVPCMFAVYDRSSFDNDKANATENVLDVLARAGVHVLWRDNSTGSKGVANRVDLENFHTPEHNTVCDGECRDTGMLVGLQDYVDRHPEGDILIVLHQMGSHGPAYFKRYPDSFRQFSPTCDTSQLDNCDEEAIRNTYDNTILYTDHFLAETIAFLRANDDHFETAMFYVSDHGESLGEGGLYLHGLPYFMAPKEQTHVASVMWLGRNFTGVTSRAVSGLRDNPLSHDDVFHTLLGFFEVTSAAYNPERDILNLARRQDGG